MPRYFISFTTADGGAAETTRELLHRRVSELPGSIGRNPRPRGREAIAAFEAAREGVGVELRAQLIDAGDGDRAIARDVLPAIGKATTECLMRRKNVALGRGWSRSFPGYLWQ
jgi:hypothetical protein